MKYVQLPCLMALPLLLAACGAGSGADNSLSFAELEDQGVSLADRFSDLSPPTPTELPSGSATYTGFAAFVLDRNRSGDFSDADIRSTVFVSVGFDDATTAGRFDNFRSADGTTLRGTVGWDESTFPTCCSYRAEATGSLSDGRDIEVRVIGFFRGDAAEFMIGNAAGSYDGPNGSGTIEGIFVAEQ
ncbi:MULTISPECIES: hypothetical protein [unclassified Yoonia]|uniref:hypothetical protein n=1 Tax=unclassified Yoonia TaxID=2629118 RepID=UPI002AFEE4A2|nr:MULTISPECIES: hypothetical protein [unclassified Yoonia]